MNLEERIDAFVKLGHFFNKTADSLAGIHYDESGENGFVDGFMHQIKLAQEHNSWFTQSNLYFTIREWSNALTYNNITEWLRKYHFKTKDVKKVAIVMAGNIPLVGFHDFISVLISGHSVLVKQSSDDKHLIPYIAKMLQHYNPQFNELVTITEGKLQNFDAVIATGSNNTARYFEYYFKNKPSIIRKNRNSVAILTGKETEEQLNNLADDIFLYYGLGCRNVSKLYIPQDYDFDAFYNGAYKWKDIIFENKYANNYDYNKAVYLMSEFKFLDNGFLMLKEDSSYGSPIATVFYEKYENIEMLKEKLLSDSEQIQCIVSDGVLDSEIKFGTTQKPSLWDYADNVDTIEFLSIL